ncbi:MAG: VCBS repeat-containing protein [Planctomycetes bacterium]|nr:VCBS repeat-containing protein [Planctomycetota bacterium]
MSISRLFQVSIITLFAIVAVSCDTTSGISKILPIETYINNAFEGIQYSYTFQVKDSAIDVRWSIENNPSWLTIGAVTGKLEGTPPIGFSEADIIEFTVIAKSVENSTDKGSVNVNLTILNTANPEDSGVATNDYFSNSVVSCDIENDGDLDLIIADYFAPIKIWLNDGNANFTDSGQSLGNSATNRMAAGDLNADGFVDFVEVCDQQQPTFVWLNDQTGKFTNTTLPGVTDSVNVLLTDVDGDGDLDIVESNDGPNRIFFNDGLANFIDSGQALGGLKSDSVAAGDIDIDGDIDIVFGNGVNAPNTVWLNDGTGIFSDTGQRLGSGITGGSVLADIDNDGDLDYLTGNFDGANLVWINDGTGVFYDSGQRLGMAASASINVIDIEGDGDIDIVTANYLDQANNIWLNNGAGTFTNANKPMGSESSTFVAFGDYDGDGDQDIAFSNGNMYTNTRQSVKVYENR